MSIVDENANLSLFLFGSMHAVFRNGEKKKIETER